ncbi:Uncaracterized surface protein containing fasciclin (FAS1) repeats [Arenibacter palladensis]|uniref:Uncaracterized surface protein containing fasciclin (FAS1) repeats n=1 Tax=Arenibacter palladensis TaxID=237373 RepID=A0A1M5GEI0_9FLAO|nr:fasciclin domain-containing protein [Arenibacter palladensis]SHG01902.1 Uncaracterized surface protein containing fasciclin (FAS1) repeats [Arenibacter palladensis]
MKKFGIYFLALFSSMFFVLSCSNDDDNDIVEEPTLSTIVETAQDTDILSSLVAALAKADENTDSDLIGALSGNGPFTVFAPTNGAFTALLASLDDFDSLSDFDTPEKREILAAILKYHVVVGAAATSSSLTNGQEFTTLQGEKITVRIDGDVYIQDPTDTDAKVGPADITASNGIVHVIDKVLIPQEVLDALNPEPMPNIVELAMDTEFLSLLVGALVQADAGLVDLLQTDGPFTVFAPTDTAFATLLEALGDDYNSLADFDTPEEKALLAQILKYHVVAGAAAYSTDLSDGQMIETAQGESVTVSLTGGVFIQDKTDVDAAVAPADIAASNGVVHVIDKVLLPQEALDALMPPTPNIVELAMDTEFLSLLVGALVQADAGLVDLLQTDGPFTVYAPTDTAFAALLEALGDDYNSLADFDTPEEKALLAQILKYHVVAGAAAYSTDLSDGQMIETAQGESVTVSLTGGVFIQDKTDVDAAVAPADITASNGVVHVIDKVLLPQEALDALMPPTPNIVELAMDTEFLSLLVGALVQADAGLVDLLQTEGPFTVFAPTDTAFAALLDALGDDYNSLADFDTPEEKALLAQILKYHVVAGAAAYSTDLSDGQMIETAQGESVTVSLTGGVFIQDKTDVDAAVAPADIAASNGVVHVIDKVMLPQEAIDALLH